MGWTAAYPTLCRKRPTASLVSRKVLTPLLGQVLICILVQAVCFEAVRRQPWYVNFPNHIRRNVSLLPSRFIPPKVKKEKSNIENSENTSLFFISCFQYILSGIVLSVGPPFRQSMTKNRKFPPFPTSSPSLPHLPPKKTLAHKHPSLTPNHSPLRHHHNNRPPLHRLPPLRPCCLAGKIHATDAHALGFQTVHSRARAGLAFVRATGGEEGFWVGGKMDWEGEGLGGAREEEEEEGV